MVVFAAAAPFQATLAQTDAAERVSRFAFAIAIAFAFAFAFAIPITSALRHDKVIRRCGRSLSLVADRR